MRSLDHPDHASPRESTHVTDTATNNGRFPTNTIIIVLTLMGSVYLLKDLTTEQIGCLTAISGLAAQVLQLMSESRRR